MAFPEDQLQALQALPADTRDPLVTAVLRKEAEGLHARFPDSPYGEWFEQGMGQLPEWPVFLDSLGSGLLRLRSRIWAARTRLYDEADCPQWVPPPDLQAWEKFSDDWHNVRNVSGVWGPSRIALAHAWREWVSERERQELEGALPAASGASLPVGRL
jgi:hypothetical protein